MRLRGGALAVELALLGAGLAACSSRDTVATRASTGGDTPPYASPVLPDGTCPGALVRRYFGKAVCTCGGASLSADLVTDGFDSRVSAWTAGGAGGDVGFVGGLAFNQLLQVGGSLAISGGGVQAGATLSVAGDLDAGGDLGRPASLVTVGGSARIGGSVGVTSLGVGGTLTVPIDATLSGTITAASTTRGPVDVAPPCPCDAASALDVAAFVAQRRVTNDNASIPLASSALSQVSTATTLPLPSGSFYLDGVTGGASITLRATGKTALYIGGGVNVSGPLAIELDPGAELDIFVAGSVSLSASARIGDPRRPGALRLWVAGGTLNVPSDAQLASLLYAPTSDLVFGTPTDVFGAVLVLHVLNHASLSVHYDRAVAGVSAACN